MSFTDRYIELPIKTTDKLTEESFDDHMKLNPFHIVKYRPTFDRDDTEEKNEIVAITDITGDVTLVYLTEKQFENLLNNHLQKTNNHG